MINTLSGEEGGFQKQTTYEAISIQFADMLIFFPTYRKDYIMIRAYFTNTLKVDCTFDENFKFGVMHKPCGQFFGHF